MDPEFLMTLHFETPTDQQIQEHEQAFTYPIDPDIQKLWDTMVKFFFKSVVINYFRAKKVRIWLEQPQTDFC
jgi:hypothetical protein